MRYLFAYDPNKAWLYHSLKTTLVTLAAIFIAILEMNLSAIWCILPSFLIMLLLNTQLPFRQRIQQMLLLWGICCIVVVLMMLVHAYYWLSIGMFVVIALITSLMIQAKPDTMKAALLAAIIALLAIRFKIDFTEIKSCGLNLLLSLGLLIVANVVFFPNRLPRQMNAGLWSGIRILGQYYYFLITDATVGNHDSARRSELQQQSLTVLDYLTKLSDTYQKVYPKTQYVDIVNLLQELNYLAIGVEAALSRLTIRAYLNGPLEELQNYSSICRELFIDMRKRNYSRLTALSEAQCELLRAIHVGKETVKQHMSPLKHDYQQWYQVAFCIEFFNEKMTQYISILQEHCNE